MNSSDSSKDAEKPVLSASLARFLNPFLKYLDEDGVNDVYLDEPGVVWVMRNRVWKRHEEPDLIDMSELERLGQLIALNSGKQEFNASNPIVSAALPTGERVELNHPSVCRSGRFSITIRVHSVLDLSMEDFEEMGMFEGTHGVAGQVHRHPSPAEAEIMKEWIAGNWREFITKAWQVGLDIVVAGKTGTGKTTFLNALLKKTPADEKILVIEDTPEISEQHQNAAWKVSHRDSKDKDGENKGSMIALLTSALRQKPDRILFGELRGPEAQDYLEGIKTGHEGSLTSTHTDSAESAIERISELALRNPVNHGVYTWAEMSAKVRATINVVVFLRLERHGEGKRTVVAEIYYDIGESKK